MSGESKRTLELLRQRDKQKRTMQVWLGLLVIWGVVVGWLFFLIVRSRTESSGPALAILTYLIPLAVLAIGVWMHSSKLRAINNDLVSAAESDSKRG